MRRMWIFAALAALLLSGCGAKTQASEPWEELGFEVYNHVQQQVYALKSLKGNAPAKPEVVSDASNRLLLALDGNPMEYRISESECFEGAEWL